MKSIATSIATALKSRRLAMRMTQKEVAMAANMPTKKISRFEGGLQEPSLSETWTLCEVLRLEMNEITKAARGRK